MLRGVVRCGERRGKERRGKEEASRRKTKREKRRRTWSKSLLGCRCGNGSTAAQESRSRRKLLLGRLWSLTYSALLLPSPAFRMLQRLGDAHESLERAQLWPALVVLILSSARWQLHVTVTISNSHIVRLLRRSETNEALQSAQHGRCSRGIAEEFHTH